MCKKLNINQHAWGKTGHNLRTSSVTVDFVYAITNLDTSNEAIGFKGLLSLKGIKINC
jgi:hypothetical protein